MSESDELRLPTDVLVLGTGGAGLRAALAAREAGAEVLVVSKMRADDPNCTAAAWGGTTYATPALEAELFRQVVHTGGFLNDQRLVEAFVRDVPATIADLHEMGVPLEILDNADTAGRLGVARVQGGSGPRGFGMVRPMRRRAEAIGARFMDELMIASLLVRDGRVIGAAGVQLRDGCRVIITARAVVIACGGGAGLFARTDNPPGTTGDGIALAYAAGAELVDIELISFTYPAGRMAEAFAATTCPTDELLSVGAAHYFLGGVRIDERGQTGLAGLFAAGEAAGGLFGAGRLGGAALGDVLVFGAIAGREAATYAAAADAVLPAEAELRQARAPLDAALAGGGVPAEEVTARLRAVMWRCCGPIKSRRSLEDGLRELEQLEGLRPTLGSNSPEGRRALLECASLLTIARPILLASLMREETRGCFWRHDFPEPRNADWLQNTLWRREDGQSRHELRPAVMTRLTEPTAPRIGAGCFDYLSPGETT